MKKHTWLIAIVVIVVVAFLLLRPQGQPTPSRDEGLIGEGAKANTQVEEDFRSSATDIIKNVVCDLKKQNVAFDLSNPTSQELPIKPDLIDNLNLNGIKILWNKARIATPHEKCGADKIGPGQTLHCVGYFGIIQPAKKFGETESAPRPNQLTVITPESRQTQDVYCN